MSKLTATGMYDDGDERRDADSASVKNELADVAKKAAVRAAVTAGVFIGVSTFAGPVIGGLVAGMVNGGDG